MRGPCPRPLRSRSLRRAANGELRTLQRKDASRARPFSRRRIDFDAAAVQFDEGTHNGKANSGGAMARPRCMGFETIENLFEYFGRNSTPLVGKPKHDFTVLPHRREIDGLTA